jgi:TolB-like protein
MNRLRIPIFILTLALCGTITAPSQELDQELSMLATKLAALTKDNGKQKVTVLDFTDLQGGGSELGKYIAEELTVNLVMVKENFAVLDRANLQRILAEHKLTAQGLVDPENAKKLGQFAGVDAIVLGTIIPKGPNIGLTAKIITTDTAEIVGAARAEFKSDETVQHLLSQVTKPGEAAGPADEPAVVPGTLNKPFTDLRVMVESLKMLPDDAGATLTLVITNTSATKIYGTGIYDRIPHNLKLINDKSEDFYATEVFGIGVIYENINGALLGKSTEILPRNFIKITAKFSVRWAGQPGDYRPYRLQVVMVFAAEEDVRNSQWQTYNLLMDIP